MWKILLDALVDTCLVFPFLLLIYIIIELLEHKTSFAQDKKVLQGPLAPLLGSATGLVPQCGFSVMAAKLYDRGFIKTGTLISVFIATSDEAFIILLASGPSAAWLAPLAAIKLLLAVGVGYLVNFLLSNEKVATPAPEDGLQDCFCGRLDDKANKLNAYLFSPFLHALKISLYLLLVNIIFGCIIAEIGEDKIAASLIGGPYLQPLITSAIGLIPNCASSVIITGAFINKGIYFGSCVAGLCTNAGLGLLVLFKNTKKLKRNILIVVVLYVISVGAGILVNSIMVLTGLI